MTLAPAPPAARRLYALIPCAGVGERAGAAGPKQYAMLGGRSLVAHTLAALAQVGRLDAVLVVLSPEDARFERHAAGFAGWVSRHGGASRAQTVANGLDDLLARGARPHDWVLVHDAARCLVRATWIDALIDACLDDPVGGLLGLPLADTLKSEREGRVAATIDRRDKWQAQTPQMFRTGAGRRQRDRRSERDRGARPCAHARARFARKPEDHVSAGLRSGRTLAEDQMMTAPMSPSTTPAPKGPEGPLRGPWGELAWGGPARRS
jgi:2-C-methyl-D-erythritol 4-phosphate cytidylyltransferase